MKQHESADGNVLGVRDRMRLLGGYLLLSAIFEDKTKAAPQRVIRLRGGGHRPRIHFAPQRVTVR